MIYIADTHPIVWFLEGNPRLGNNAKAVLSDPQTRLVIPTIVLVEVHFLYARKRISVNVPSILALVVSAANCIIYPLDRAE